MKKKLLILVVGVIAIFNLSILIENKDGINIGLDYLKIAKADTENIETTPPIPSKDVPASKACRCNKPGTSWRIRVCCPLDYGGTCQLTCDNDYVNAHPEDFIK